MSDTAPAHEATTPPHRRNDLLTQVRAVVRLSIRQLVRTRRTALFALVGVVPPALGLLFAVFRRIPSLHINITGWDFFSFMMVSFFLHFFLILVALSFAQFERQMIGERTRDKMRAARRRGRWTGGMPPLGYDVAPDGGVLVVNKDEAAIVRAIFELYAENPSLVNVSQELNRRGWRRKSWTTKTGTVRTGSRWDRRTLSNLLRDPINVGRQKLGSETYDGEHRAIVPKALFSRVQALLDKNLRDRGSTARNKHGELHESPTTSF